MNWKEIKKKYPKAWNKMLEWKDYLEINDSVNEHSDQYGTIGWHFNATPVHSHLVLWRTYELRNFYDFFDENGIYLLVTKNWSYRAMDQKTTYLDWGFDIYIENSEDCYKDGSCLTRTLAEQSAFTKAFEILETKLK